MKLTQLISAIKGKLPHIASFSKQTAVVILAAVLSAVVLYFVVTQITSDQATDSTGRQRPAKTAAGGTLINAVVQPKSGVRDLFQYSRDYAGSSSAKELPVMSDGGGLAISKPAIRPSAGSFPSVSTPAAVVSYGGDVVLRGLAKSGITRYALVQYAGRTQVYRAGDSFGPYTVSSISDGQMVLRTPNGPVTIYQQRLQSTARQPRDIMNGGAGNEK